MTMKHYVVFDPVTGEIEVSGVCQDDDFRLQARPGKELLEASASSQTHFVQNGETVAYSAEQALAKSITPGMGHVWSNASFSWVDTRTSAAILSDAAAAARASRDRLLAESDWTDTLSAQTRLGDALYNAWQDYRQILRDVPQQAGFPQNIAWPEPPSPT